jgi:hypothetical protein
MPSTNRVTPEVLRQAPLAPGEAFLLHRHTQLDHIDSPECWCSPIQWSFADCKLMAYGDIQRHLNEFYCVS